MNWRRVAFFVIYAAAFGAAAYYLRSLSVALWGLIGFVALAFIMGPVRRAWRSLMPAPVVTMKTELEEYSVDLWWFVAAKSEKVVERGKYISSLGDEMYRAMKKGKGAVYPSNLPFDLFLYFMPRYVFDLSGLEVGDAALKQCRVQYVRDPADNSKQAITYLLHYPVGATDKVQTQIPAVHRYFDSIRCGYTGLALNVAEIEERTHVAIPDGEKVDYANISYRWLYVRLVSQFVSTEEAERALSRMRALYRNHAVRPEFPVQVVRQNVDSHEFATLGAGTVDFIPYHYPVGHLREGYLYFGDRYLEDMAPYWVPVKKLTHFLVSGMSGSGKSVFLHQFLAGVAHNERFFDDVYLIDLKGGVELWRYEGKANGLFHVAYQFEKVVELVDGLNELMDERLEQMRERGIRDWDGGKVLVVIDEYAELAFEMPEDREGKAIKQRLLARLSRLSSKARAAGIILWAQLQKGTTDVMDSSFRNNLQSEVMFKPKSKLIAAQVFGSTEELKVDPTRLPAGYFVMFDGATGELVYLKSRMVREMM